MEAAVFTTEFVRNFEFRLSPGSMNVKREASMVSEISKVLEMRIRF